MSLEFGLFSNALLDDVNKKNVLREDLTNHFIVEDKDPKIKVNFGIIMVIT